MERLILIGRILSAHGIKGEVKLKSFTAEPLAVAGYGPLQAKDGRVFELSDVRPQGDVLIVTLKGVRDRTAAERFQGVELYVDRSVLPETEDEEFYHADLIGLAVCTADGAVVGRIKAIQNFGAGDLLEIEGASGGGEFVPFTKRCVPEVSVGQGRVVLSELGADILAGLKAAGEGFAPARRRAPARARTTAGARR